MHRARSALQATAADSRAALAPLAARSGTAAGRGLGRLGQWLRRVADQRVAPALARARAGLAYHLHPRSLGRYYRRLLGLLHAAVTDRKADALFFVPTRGRIKLRRLSIPSRVRETGHEYKPTPRLVFEWAMAALPEDLEHSAFIDYGAGRGRALLLASRFPFERIQGAEIARELCDDCRMNIAQYPRSLMRCRDVECIHCRATTLTIPDQPAVFYFFDPFDLSIFDKLLARIVRSYKRNRRELHLICIGMEEQESVAAQGIFHPVAFSVGQRLKIWAFSPYSIRVYRTDP